MKNKYDRSIDSQTYVIQGVIIDVNESKYSSTHVSGNIADNGVAVTGSVNSTVRHHHDQLLWIKTDHGSEKSINLHDVSFEGRIGHEVVGLYSKQGLLLELGNRTTGDFWRATGPNCIANSATGKIKRWISTVVIAPFLGLFTAIPILNLLMLLFVIVLFPLSLLGSNTGNSYRAQFSGHFLLPAIIAFPAMVFIVIQNFPIISDFIPNDLINGVYPLVSNAMKDLSQLIASNQLYGFSRKIANGTYTSTEWILWFGGICTLFATISLYIEQRIEDKLSYAIVRKMRTLMHQKSVK